MFDCLKAIDTFMKSLNVSFATVYIICISAAGADGDTLQINSENLSLAEGAPRIKFGCHWKGTIESLKLDEDGTNKYRSLVNGMADAMWELEQAGVTPVAPDGKVGGNAAAIFSSKDTEYIIVSKSGKNAGQRMNEVSDICIVEKFYKKEWEVDYRSISKEVLPTSDSPLHYAALNAHKQFKWSERPGVVLHGHALETEEEAIKYNFPCSTEQTLFSTPSDAKALLDLLSKHPYPDNRVFIRKGHGFLLLAIDMEDAVDTFRKLIKPHLAESNKDM